MIIFEGADEGCQSFPYSVDLASCLRAVYGTISYFSPNLQVGPNPVLGDDR